MERPIFKPIGSPVDQLDTPALVVDLDVLESNIETVHSFFRDRDAKLRPHIESHRCPAIAHLQLAGGGTVGGVSVTTVGEAEVFAQNGFTDVFVANEVITSAKIARLCGLARSTKITVAVDSADNVAKLSEAAQSNGVNLNVVVDVHTRLERCGVEPGQPALDLASAVTKAQNLRFAGLMSYEGAIISDNPDVVYSESKKAIQPVLDTREMIEKAGMPVDVVSVGGTHNYEMAGAMSGVTEVPAGSYALMDHRYTQSRPQLHPAARVMSTIISHPISEKALSDCGQKALGLDLGLPVIDEFDGASFVAMSAEHGHVMLEGDAQNQASVGDKIWLIPYEMGTTTNVYDYIHAVRDGKLETVWDVSARGRYR